MILSQKSLFYSIFFLFLSAARHVAVGFRAPRGPPVLPCDPLADEGGHVHGGPISARAPGALWRGVEDPADASQTPRQLREKYASPLPRPP